MNYDEFKIKHIIESYQDQNTISLEDILFMICEWYYEKGGYTKIHNQRNIEDIDKVIFSDRDFKKYLRNNTNDPDRFEELFDNFVEKGLNKNLIEHIKQTSYSNFYKIIKNFK